jgi:hypothetical protein
MQRSRIGGDLRFDVRAWYEKVDPKGIDTRELKGRRYGSQHFDMALEAWSVDFWLACTFMVTKHGHRVLE